MIALLDTVRIHEIIPFPAEQSKTLQIQILCSTLLCCSLEACLMLLGVQGLNQTVAKSS